MVVEASLPDRHHLVMAGVRNQLVGAEIEFLVRIVGMGADRAIDLGIALGNGENFGQPPDPGRNGDDPGDAGRPRPRDHGIEVAREIGKVEMAMAVNKHEDRRQRTEDRDKTEKEVDAKDLASVLCRLSSG